MDLLLIVTPTSTLLPMLWWAFSSASFFVVSIDARPDAIFSSGSSLPPPQNGPAAAPLFSPQPQPPFPEMGVAVKVVVHVEDLNRRILVALIVASTLLFIILLSLSFIWIYRLRTRNANDSIPTSKRKKGATNGPAMDPISDSSRMGGKKSSVVGIDYKVLEAATNSFHESNILGEGSHGSVYRAQFEGKLFGAVKRSEGGGQEGETQFENEVKWLTKFQHQNIISVLGHCVHGGARFLVYEMMQNGSLESQLHGPSSGTTLTWHLRLKIAVDVARGMEYLHEHCHPPVVHRDIKSSNILLDSNFNAKLSDFGLAVASGNQNKSITLSGTLGYVAPEYLLDGKLSDKSDVYAFGVVLLELLTGRKPVENVSAAECQSIVSWAMPQLTDRSKLPNIVDPVIKDSMDLKHLYQVAAVAVLCVQREASYRPLITDVLHSLIPLVPHELGGSLRMTEVIMPTAILS